MPPVKIIKQSAKNSLKGKWDIAIAIGSLFIAVLCIGALTISVLSSFFAGFSNTSVGVILSAIIVVGLWQFLGVPLLYGSLRWAWYTSLGENVPFYEVFYYFEDGYSYIRSISLGFRIFVRFILILIVCFAPYAVISIICAPGLYNLFNLSMPYFVSSLWALGNVLRLFGAILSFFLLIRYFSAPLILINDKNISPQEALELSVVISKYSNGRTLLFLSSFFLWFILSGLMLPLLYIVPYFLVAYAAESKALIDNYNGIAKFQASKMYPHYQPDKFR